MRISPSSDRSVISDDHEPEAGQRDRDRVVAAGAQPRQVHRLDRGVPVEVDGGGGVEQPGQRADDQVGQRVGDRAGVVEPLPPPGEPARGDEVVGGVGQAAGHVGDGQRAQRGVAVGGADQPPDHRREHRLVGHRGPVALGLGQRGEQRGPAADDPGELLALPGDRPAAPPAGERAEVQGVEPGPAAAAQRDRGDPERLQQRGVLALHVPGDQRFGAEQHHPQDQRDDGGGLAPPGFAEDHQVGVGGQPAQHPLDGVAVEGAARQRVVAHPGADRGQRVGRQQREQPADLGGGCLVDRPAAGGVDRGPPRPAGPVPAPRRDRPVHPLPAGLRSCLAAVRTGSGRGRRAAGRAGQRRVHPAAGGPGEQVRGRARRRRRPVARAVGAGRPRRVTAVPRAGAAARSRPAARPRRTRSPARVPGAAAGPGRRRRSPGGRRGPRSASSRAR